MRQLSTVPNNQTALAPKSKDREHIALLIDASGSMSLFASESKRRIDAAQDAIIAILASSNPSETQYSLHSYESSCHHLVPATSRYLVIQGARIPVDGGTNIAAGINGVLDVASPSRIILLSDGEDNYGREYAIAAAARSKTLGIKIDTIAFGEADDELLRTIAEISGGRFAKGDTPADLKKIFISLEPKNYLRLAGS